MKDYEMLWLSTNGHYAEYALKTVATCKNGGRVAKSAAAELVAALGAQSHMAEDGQGDIQLCISDKLAAQGYSITGQDGRVTVCGGDGAGLLYGVHALLRSMAQGVKPEELAETAAPANPLRMLNHWDNADGSVERGYSGKSFFFKEDKLLVNERTRDYARLVASVGINAVVINNVNVKGAATGLIADAQLGKLNELAEQFADYGIKLYLSANFAAPMELGELATADPLDAGVCGWWADTCARVFGAVKNFGGFLVKADSEGRPGPFTYGRTHADGANMLARAIAPHGGNIIWRCFVYNCQQDWRDRITDRARSAYDNFMPLDGKFLPNVFLQIKNGPMDFQVREPVTPLFGALKKTNCLLEVQIAQEYTGQQKHLCYLPPMWKEVLAFKTCCADKADRVQDVICGMAAVSNTGNDPNWTGHDLAAANLYGYGRLSFDHSLTAQQIANEWIALCYQLPAKQTDMLCKMLMGSWHTYEKYTSPLGIGWMVNPNHHFGPSVDGYEYDRWGTYHRADINGMGVDRSSHGTGYATLYFPQNAKMYETIETCPEELLLFFHYLPYTHRLSGGKTLIQHIYDTHFEGADEAAAMVDIWQQLREYLPESIHARALERLNFQKKHSCEWRDVVNSYFYRKCGIPDEQGRMIY